MWVGLFRRAVSTTRARLLLLVGAILAPLAIFAFWLFLRAAETEQARYSADAVATARLLSATIDRELGTVTAAAEALATSPALAASGRDLAVFERQADELLRHHGYALVLRDAEGRQLLNTEHPRDALPATPSDQPQRAVHQRAMQSGQPAISDLIHGVRNGKPMIIVMAPVLQDGQANGTLSIRLSPDYLSSILAQAARPGWRISLVDRQDHLIASSREDPSYVGRLATDDLRRETTGEGGTWLGTTLEGTRVLGAYARSSLSGWRVAVGIPLSAIDLPLRRLTAVAAFSGLLVCLLALFLALLLARSISRPINRLARAAAAFGRDGAMPEVITGLREVDEVAAELTHTEATISERTAALQASEERFRAAVRAMEGWIWTNDPAGRMTGEQPGWSALTGQASAEYEGYGWAAAVHPEDAQPTILAWEAAVRARSTFIFEHRVRCRDGVFRRFSIRAVPVLDPRGEVLQWVGVHTDITVAHDATAQLAAQEAALRDLNATLARRVEEASAERDRIWRLSTELMLVAHISGRIVAANPSWSRTLGWSEDELLGVSFRKLLHPDDVAAATADARRLARGAILSGVELRLRHKDDGYRWLSWTAVPERGLMHAIARDITAEKQQAEALHRTEEQLRQSQKMEVVGQLTGGIAHDFNNLLTVVSGQLEMARRRISHDRSDPAQVPPEAARVLRHLDAAFEGARRAAVLTHRLLAFSRQSPLRPEPVELNVAIAGMAELIRRTLGETIHVETDFAPDLWPIEADLNQIENAILNLCVNARDAMASGGRLRIETRNLTLGPGAVLVQRGELPAGDYAAVAVSDTGPGIPSDIQDRVFEPFFTTKPVGKGTGLGLSQVFGFLRQSGGLAVIHSPAGEGATITLYFRRAAKSAMPAAPLPAPAPAGRPSTPRAVACLVVEDEEMVRSFTVSALEEAGYRVLAAADGPAGLALLDATPGICLLFTDIVLTGPLDGRAVAEEALRRRPGLKILLTTGYTSDATILAGKTGPAMDIIQKPFTSAALLDRIAHLLSE